jgi:hypothetical protein
MVYHPSLIVFRPFHKIRTMTMFFPLASPPLLWHNIRDMRRWIGFLIAMAIGAAGGLFYGWVVNPVKYVDTTLDSLRIDYQSDYVLMVAETFTSDASVPNAIHNLEQLGDATPVELVQKALNFAREHGYSDNDLATMTALLQALQAWNPILGTLTP